MYIGKRSTRTNAPNPSNARSATDTLQMLSMESQVLNRFSRHLADSYRLSVDIPNEVSDTQQGFCRCSHGVSDFLLIYLVSTIPSPLTLRRLFEIFCRHEKYAGYPVFKDFQKLCKSRIIVFCVNS